MAEANQSRLIQPTPDRERRQLMKQVRPFLVWVSIVGPPTILLIALTAMGYREYTAWRDVGDYLKLAADAPSLPLAERYLSTAIRNIESRGWTSGNTALIFKVPRLDLGLWYQNTNGAFVEVKALVSMDQALTPVDRSNALVKLRETLMDGNALTFPKWIELAPHNAFFFWATLLSMLGSINSILVLVRMIPEARWTTPMQPSEWFQTIRSWIDWQAGALGSARSRRR